jgi:hypothetical protein
LASNLLSWLTRSPKNREIRATYDLISQARATADRSPFNTDERVGGFLFDLIHDICEQRNVIPTNHLGEALWECIENLLYLEGFIVHLPDKLSVEQLTVEEGVELRKLLKQYLRFLEDHERLLSIWREKIVLVFSGMLEYLPLSAFTDLDEEGNAIDRDVMLPEARTFDLCDNLTEAIERTLITFFDTDIKKAHLFDTMRERINDNVMFASGIPKDKQYNVTREKVKLPSDHVGKSPEYLLEIYFQGTPFISFFSSPLPFSIPFPARFEHTHIIGGTGHGKTQLMQFLIYQDFVKSLDDGRSVVVMDSQGDLIRTLSQLDAFSPALARSLSDRFVLIDPNDIEYPVCLNMFDFSRDRLSGYAPVDREKILNGTIELYEYFFGALLGAELTQRQGLIFRYLARLMLEIPDATIHTLRELMENGERFRPYMLKLQGTARNFFETRFFDRQFNETKKQILTRLWGVLSNSSLERMFSHTKNKIDIFELLNQGKIIFINTAKDLLGEEGTAIFGRFFISLIAQAVIQRSAIPSHERNPSFIYIDECQDYFDDNISNLLNQARKYRVSLAFAHQNLDQLSAGLRSSVLASTTIKFAGGVSAKDASILSHEYRCDSDFLLKQRKHRDHSEFACYIKNYTSNGLSIHIPLGFVEQLTTHSIDEHRLLIETNRSLYCAPIALPSPAQVSSGLTLEPPYSKEPTIHKSPEFTAPVPPSDNSSVITSPEVQMTSAPAQTNLVSKAIPLPTKKIARRQSTPGGGGQKHKYLQNLIKGLAEKRGFRAGIEEPILDGTGRVDVSIVKGDCKVAFEISVTTNKDHELSNIEKCFAAGYTRIACVGQNERHLKALSKFIEASLDEPYRGIVIYIMETSLPEFIDSLDSGHIEPQVIYGYKVRVKKTGSEIDAQARRDAIAEIISKSIAKKGQD